MLALVKSSPHELIHGVSRFTDHDIYLFREGSHFRLFEKLGAHCMRVGEQSGVLFAVWAPNARYVSVIGDFNGWAPGEHPLRAREDGSGIWEGFVAGVGNGQRYKYHIASHYHGYSVDKGDPFATRWEAPPSTASVVWDLDYRWDDAGWMQNRHQQSHLRAPNSVYEMHIGSWRRVPEDGNRSLTYRELADQLPDYLAHQGFTHVEFLPVMEHPFYGSWGYQTTGYYAPTARYGTPQDFMYLIDRLHQRGVGVILDWVPSHFPSDAHGLAYFDGTHLFEHEDPRQGFHPEWKSSIFNYGRNEVRAILISNAIFWLQRYHADGLRIDAVASMLYLDYGRKEGEWIPNRHGGRENLEAVGFLRDLNAAVYREFPDTQTIAEESTSWPMVSRPVYLGGLGFGKKWNMGWMHDTLDYLALDPVFRRFHHGQITFSIWYAFFENFVLPLSHDEVVYGKGSLIRKMPGDDWQKFASLRLLFGYMWGHPGNKLLFMGGEIGQWNEWNHESSVQWHLNDCAPHHGVQVLIEDLNRLYRGEKALHELDFEPGGFEWVEVHDSDNSVLAFLRKGCHADDKILAAINFTPMPRHNYRLGVPDPGCWQEVLNTDAARYGGSDLGNYGGTDAAPLPAQGRPYSLTVTLPPLAAVFFKKPSNTRGG